MTDLPKLDFSALAALAGKPEHTNSDCACSKLDLQSWISVPLSLDEENLQDVGTLFEDPYAEPTFTEYHPAGTHYDSPDAPIAPLYYPYNRCTVAVCKKCGRHYLRYTEAGGYFVDRRIRLLSPQLLIDAVL
ncbi:hypothetical protein [Undibacterium terreum]|uniref:Uncharacterized protein n=1 Tax=Undibacterium terreum TaxID=1224302 RepID=A0A916UBR7_9BURK|nr:hypothetical protein [Undibacterium terreum]GGC67876.1 hypothetical protein GCM10011396_13670 [Undibacterium terreum]